MKKILVILIIATLFLSGCNATGSESTPVTQTIENPSSTLVVLSNSINELEIDNILNCFDLAQPDKDMVTSKFEDKFKTFICLPLCIILIKKKYGCNLIIKKFKGFFFR